MISAHRALVVTAFALSVLRLGLWGLDQDIGERGEEAIEGVIVTSIGALVVERDLRSESTGGDV